jgi:hypothetical protein
VAFIAAGGAGLVAGTDHVPGTAARPELTWAGDAAARIKLEAARTDLVELAARVEELGTLSRGALAAMIARDLETLDASVARGGGLVADIRGRTVDLRVTLDGIPGAAGPDAVLLVSREIRVRHAALGAALDATAGLDGAWARLTSGAVSATRLSLLLEQHDIVMGEAAAAGRDADYVGALTRIEVADRALAAAREMRRVLANTVDVTVLDEWIDRNATYDVALAGLYRSLVESDGRVTDAVREAQAAETAARSRLPPDSRGLVIIMAEIGRGGMNGAIITIEEARGRLGSSIDALDASADRDRESADTGPMPPP